MRKLIGSVIVIGFGVIAMLVALIQLYCWLEWRPGWLAIGAGLMVGGFWLMLWPRQRIPWKWGLVRWLIGEYTCEVHGCNRHEGFGRSDVRSQHMRIATISTESDPHLIIGGRKYTVPFKAVVELRRCGFYHPFNDFHPTRNQLVIKQQASGRIAIKFQGVPDTTPTVSLQLAVRVLRFITKFKLPKGELESYVLPRTAP